MCTFNHSEINSITIQFFPKCSEICGILIFISGTDLSEYELKEAFPSMHTLFGGIVIENTHLTSLSFFTTDSLYGEFHFFCEDYGFFIRNNLFLTDISILNSFYMWTDDDFNECEFRIENNSILDTSALFDNYLTYLDVTTPGNFKDYGCRGDQINQSNLKDYEKCDHLFGGLKIENLIGDLSSLSKIKVVNGFIDIQNTEIEDLSFLKNLEYIQMKNIGLKKKISVNIKNNLKMNRLGTSAFQNLQFNFDFNRIANLENLHPNFCLTVEEMRNFLELNLFFVNIHAKYCDDVGNLQGLELCRLDRMSNLKKNCEFVFGNILVESGEEEYVKRLNRMTHLFGSIEIRNTKLKNLDFLKELRYIGTLDGKTRRLLGLL
uniref:Recep_L_domain domain-containing protein n=2 Tax=Caenorhabditis tropicalis TaxID=1561998 RepID=A0A1I7UFH8_9PELO